MNNKSVNDLIIVSTIQTSALITLWGLANYLNQNYDLDESIIYQSKLFNLRIKGSIFFRMASLASLGIMCLNLTKLSEQK